MCNRERRGGAVTCLTADACSDLSGVTHVFASAPKYSLSVWVLVLAWPFSRSQPPGSKR